MFRCHFYSLVHNSIPGIITYKGVKVMGTQSQEELERLYDSLPPESKYLQAYNAVVCFTNKGDVYVWVDYHFRDEKLQTLLQKLNIELFEG